MAAVALHTHWVPQYWRSDAHTRAVRDEFQGLFQLRLVLFAEEAASVLLLPWLCGVCLARCAPDIARFLHRVRPPSALSAPRWPAAAHAYAVLCAACCQGGAMPPLHAAGINSGRSVHMLRAVHHRS